MKYDALTSKETVEKTMKALKPRGINPEFVSTKEDALSRLKQLIPSGAEMMTAGSTTLDQIGFTDFLISGKHPWNNLKAVSYTHLRAHETRHDLVCRLL